MAIQAYLNSFALRYALRMGLAVLLAIFVDYYFFVNHNGLICLAAFFASQTTKGTPLRQGLICLVVMLVAMCLTVLLLRFISQQQVIYLLLVLLFAISAFFIFIRYYSLRVILLMVMIFSIAFLVLMQPARPAWTLVQNRIIDILIGYLLGQLCVQAFTNRLVTDFQDGMLSVFRLLMAYSETLMHYFDHPEKFALELTTNRQYVQRIWLQNNIYPEWVYEVGFSPGLRSGFRFFLVTVEQLCEVLFSLQYIMSQPIEIELWQSISHLVNFSLRQNQELMQLLIAFFSHHTWQAPTSDLVADIAELEEKLQSMIPVSLELLDLSVDYVRLTSLVRHVKDWRQLLLKLILSLPETNYLSSQQTT